VWKAGSPASVADPIPPTSWRKSIRERIKLMNDRPSLRIGIPRVLNMYVYAPLFSAYLQSLGVPSENIVYSDFTTNEMYRAGSSRG
jgi:predicted nucleotide-binding protein (sugar kinase/HSP70/actin superfamily)